MGLSMSAGLWPNEAAVLDAQAYMELAGRLRPAFLELLRHEQMSATLAEPLGRVYLPLAAWVNAQRQGRPFVLGVNGAQGSGKSTLSAFLQRILREAFGLKVAGFSIDDLYRTHEERERLAREVHPLLATRGVPGTHDVALGLSLLDTLTGDTSSRVSLPVFDKAHDDRAPEEEWPEIEAPVDVVIFEGWCVGARPQPEAELLKPLNELEQRDDAEGAWRRHVNAQLAGPYAELFARIDRLVMLRVPSLSCVYEWRSLQEDKLAAKAARAHQHRIMDSSGLKRFIMHYERLTRHMLEEMPDRADITLYLDEHHQFTSIHLNH